MTNQPKRYEISTDLPTETDRNSAVKLATALTSLIVRLDRPGRLSMICRPSEPAGSAGDKLWAPIHDRPFLEAGRGKDGRYDVMAHLPSARTRANPLMNSVVCNLQVPDEPYFGSIIRVDALDRTFYGEPNPITDIQLVSSAVLAEIAETLRMFSFGDEMSGWSHAWATDKIATAQNAAPGC
jgi:hypothetical protein